MSCNIFYDVHSYLRTMFISNVTNLRSSYMIQEVLSNSKLERASVLCQKMLMQESINGDPSDLYIRVLTKVMCNSHHAA